MRKGHFQPVDYFCCGQSFFFNPLFHIVRHIKLRQLLMDFASQRIDLRGDLAQLAFGFAHFGQFFDQITNPTVVQRQCRIPCPFRLLEMRLYRWRLQTAGFQFRNPRQLFGTNGRFRS